MNAMHSLLVVGLVLGAMFVPAALAAYFSEPHSEHDDEYVPDGR